MRKLTLVVVLLASAWVGATPSTPAVVLISIDGLRPDAVTQAEQHGLHLPNLRRFLTEGAYAAGVHGIVPTVTYPSHTTLLTGVSPAKHGIHANTTFDPTGQNLHGWAWYAEDIRVPTLWSRVREAGAATVNVGWPVSVGAPVTWNLPQIWRAGTPDDTKLQRALSTPGLLTELESKLGPYPDGEDGSVTGDERRARFAEALMTAKRPGFTTVYFSALDSVEHDHGPFSPEASAVLERLDRLVGEVRRTAERVNPRTVVCVVSDHGFVETTAEVNLLVPFVTAGLVQLDAKGQIALWNATVWSAAGSAAVVLRNPADAVIRDQVEKLLRKLAAEPANGIDRIVEAAELKRLGGFPEASWLVNLRPGFQNGSAMGGPLVRRLAMPGGTHGYLPDLPAMRSTFLIAGPGVARGRSLGEISMVDIAPTLAGLMGLSLPTAEGRDLGARLSER